MSELAAEAQNPSEELVRRIHGKGIFLRVFGNGMVSGAGVALEIYGFAHNNLVEALGGSAIVMYGMWRGAKADMQQDQLVREYSPQELQPSPIIEQGEAE